MYMHPFETIIFICLCHRTVIYCISLTCNALLAAEHCADCFAQQEYIHVMFISENNS